MKKAELLYIVDYVFEHYEESDISDEAREEVERGYRKVKELIEKGME